MKKILIILAILVGGFIVFNVVSKTISNIRNPFSQNNQRESIFGLNNNDCEKDFNKFGSPPIQFEDYAFIEPMGRMGGDHILPVDHVYFRPVSWDKEPIPRNIYAPGDGRIINIERANYQAFEQFAPINDYQVTIEHSCDVFTMYIHISKFSDKIYDVIGDMKFGTSKRVNIPVKEGEIIGNIQMLSQFNSAGIYQLDFSVVDTRVTLNGFLNKELYMQGEPWKLHTVDPFDYFEGSVRGKLLEKNLRTAGPRGGKIDYDIEGKIIGNWFIGGVYRDESGNAKLDNYWDKHLAIAYDYIDPTLIRIAVGRFFGESRPGDFAVRGNAPDPAKIGVGELVKYELVGFDYIQRNTGKRWDRSSFMKDLTAEFDDRYIDGVALFQLLDNRKLKAEFFSSKKSAQGVEFTENAIIYSR